MLYGVYIDFEGLVGAWKGLAISVCLVPTLIDYSTKFYEYIFPVHLSSAIK